MRDLKYSKLDTGEEPFPKKKKYIFFDQLQFLVPFLRINDRSSTNLIEEIDYGQLEEEEPAAAKCTRSASKKKKNIKQEPERAKLSGVQQIKVSPDPLQVVQSISESGEEKSVDRYGNRAFLMSFLPIMDCLSPVDQMQVRLRISQAFTDVMNHGQPSTSEATSYQFMAIEENPVQI